MIGIGRGMGKAPTLADTYDPLSRQHVIEGTYPTEKDVSQELNQFAKQLTDLGVQVLRPDAVGINQVFTTHYYLLVNY